jgi:hypothetical protein
VSDYLAPVIAQLHVEADQYERDGALVDGARLLRRIAQRLEEVQREWVLQELTLREAAEESGQSYHTVQKAVSSGRLPNAGTKGHPRVRRCDLLNNVKIRVDGPDLAGQVLGSHR